MASGGFFGPKRPTVNHIPRKYEKIRVMGRGVSINPLESIVMWSAAALSALSWAPGRGTHIPQPLPEYQESRGILFHSTL